MARTTRPQDDAPLAESPYPDATQETADGATPAWERFLAYGTIEPGPWHLPEPVQRTPDDAA